MVVAVVVIWIAFNILSGGDFLTARNMWNLSVQSTSIAIMATGMVLVIVSRNIDLSVGSLLGFLGYVMALVQTDGVIAIFNINISLGSIGDSGWIWVIALVVGITLGAAVGGVQGFIIAYGGVPAFIVTLGGFLVWRGMIFRTGGKQGQTLAPLNDTFQLFGGGPDGSLGEWKSWLFALVGCVAHRPRPRPRPPPAPALRPHACGRCGWTSRSPSSGAASCWPPSGSWPTATSRRSPGTRPASPTPS